MTSNDDSKKNEIKLTEDNKTISADIIEADELFEDSENLFKVQSESTINLSPDFFINRELSWLEFNHRVLNEAFTAHTPLLERLKFISIFYNNLDEFFMVRVSNIYRQYINQVDSGHLDKSSPEKVLTDIRKFALRQINMAEDFWNNKLSRRLYDRGLRITTYDKLNKKQQKFLESYYHNEIYPVLTPQAIDPTHPLPNISNLSLNFIVQLESEQGHVRYARLKCPSNVSRFIFVPRTKNAKAIAALGFSDSTRDNDIILLEDLISNHLDTLFPGHKILNVGIFRITRNTDLEIEEDEADDLLEAVKDSVEQRRFGDIIRLEYSKDMPSSLCEFLFAILDLKPFQIYEVDGPLAFSQMMSLYGVNRSNLKDPGFHPYVPSLFREELDNTIYEHIKNKDIFLFHPYESFMPVQDFIRHASKDPDVIAIKQTIYRVGNYSPIVQALIEAKKNNKQVTAVVELKARFDEEQNITWAEEMEKVGINVVYGIVGMKIHSKLCLVVRREENGIRRYAHIGTGNYNASTAKIYTDMCLITAHNDICADVSDLFNVMTGYAVKKDYNHLFVSPVNLRDKLIELVDNEIEQHRKHGNGEIFMKCNQLVDRACIEALCKASAAGVKVFLHIRGICCLRPNIAGISENITIKSLVGRFLEHTRLYYFRNNNDTKMYIGSADLMPRNLDRRIEVLVPILDKKLRKNIYENIVKLYKTDNAKSYELQANGKYVKKRTAKGSEIIDSQDILSKDISKMSF